MTNKKSEDNLLKQVFITQSRGYIDIFPKRDLWAEFAAETNGSFKILHTVSQDLQKFNLKIPFNDTVIEFAESDTHPLKISCGLKSEKEVCFSISIEDAIEKVLKFFGQQDIQINDPVFDEKYLIKGSDVELTKEILNYKNVKSLILKTNVFSVVCKYNKKDEKLEIHCMAGRSVNSKEYMNDLLCLMTSVIERLVM